MAKVNAGMSKTDLLAQSRNVLGLHDINLNIRAGETFVIMGLSGSGKSTLIRHFNRLIEPTAGRILVDDVDVLTLNEADLRAFRRKKISMVFQRFALLPHKTVLENVIYGLITDGMPKHRPWPRAPRRSCWSVWRGLRTIIPDSFRAACSSVSVWQGRWRPMPRFC